MFDEILESLLNEDTSGYPDPENLEYHGYTLEALIVEMLYECLKEAEGPHARFFILDLINAMARGDKSWAELAYAMENFEG